ncbi:hypothetical protein EF879_19000 [Micromonospora sp. HM5-17]|nr:hypothetical protein EF879_19000 [Micromonospora sp. HM5-17]
MLPRPGVVATVEVLEHGGERHRHRAGESAHRRRTAAQTLQQHPATEVRQRGEDGSGSAVWLSMCLTPGACPARPIVKDLLEIVKDLLEFQS